MLPHAGWHCNNTHINISNMLDIIDTWRDHRRSNIHLRQVNQGCIGDLVRSFAIFYVTCEIVCHPSPPDVNHVMKLVIKKHYHLVFIPNSSLVHVHDKCNTFRKVLINSMLKTKKGCSRDRCWEAVEMMKTIVYKWSFKGHFNAVWPPFIQRSDHI